MQIWLRNRNGLAHDGFNTSISGPQLKKFVHHSGFRHPANTQKTQRVFFR